MNRIKLIMSISSIDNLEVFDVRTNIESYYRPGDTASICDCITDFSDKTEGFKETIRRVFPEGLLTYRIQFIRTDNSVIDEIDINIEEVDQVNRMINLFMMV